MERLESTRKRQKRIKCIFHYKYNVLDSHTTAQILHLPKYQGILLVKNEEGIISDVFKDTYYSHKKLPKFKRLVKKHNLIALHAHHGKLGIELLDLKKKYKIPLITSIRGNDVTGWGSNKDNRTKLKDLFNRGDLFLPVCQYLAYRIQELGCPRNKVRVLYGGTDLERFQYTPRKYPQNSPIRILSVGRFVEKKGFDYLIRAFAIVHEKYPNTELLLIGEGKMIGTYKQLITKLELADCVKLQKWLDYSFIHSIYHNAHIFCAPSFKDKNGREEGIPNTLKEAMATGMPVVSTFHAGIPELVRHGKSGLLVPEKIVDDLADAVIWFIENANKWEYFGGNARKKMEKDFNVYKQIERQQKYYDELIKKYGE